MAEEYISKCKIAIEAQKLSTYPLDEWTTMGVLALIDRQPAADVAEVRHARWEQHYDDPWNVHCSNCDYAMPDAVVRPNYCENCGAKTDLPTTSHKQNQRQILRQLHELEEGEDNV